MLLMAHLEREDIPAGLQKTLTFVLTKAPALTAEIVKLSAIPRPPAGYGWLAPAVGGAEFLQHLIQVACCCRLMCACCCLLFDLHAREPGRGGRGPDFQIGGEACHARSMSGTVPYQRV